MNSFIHKDLASGKWSDLSLIEQMANIGSEVYRTINFHKRKDKTRFENTFFRALELFDLTLSDERWKGREKEIARSREVFCGIFYDSEMYSEMDYINCYFLQFAILARKDK